MKEITFNKRFNFRRIAITCEKRSKIGWGRFGGGWNFKFGIQAGGSTLILDLCVMSIRFDLKNKR